MHCVLCSRPMQSASVYIGVYPVGPVCARKAGLVAIAAKGSNRVLKLANSPAGRHRANDLQMALDLEVTNA